MSDQLGALAGLEVSLGRPEFYRRLLETLAEGVSLSDNEGVIVFTNSALDQTFGYAPSELVGRHISVLNGASAEENSAVMEAVTLELRRSGMWKGVWLCRRNTGERIVVKTHITSIELEARSHWLSVHDDVTAERLAGETLKDQEARLELAVEAADLGVWDWDLCTNAFVYSKRAKEICGFPLDEPVAYDQVKAVTHPDDYPFTSEQARRATDPAIRASDPYTYRIRRADGEVRWLSARGRVVFDENAETPAALRYTGVIQDITDRHLADQRLRESEARFRALANSTPAPAWVTNAEGKVVFANQAFSTITGRSADQLLGDAWIDLLHPDDRMRVAELRARAWAQGYAPYVWEGRFPDARGQWRWMNVAAGPRFDDEHQFQGYVGIATDVTEAHQTRQELEQSERRLRLAIASSRASDWRWDSGSDRLELSPAAAEMIGIEPVQSWRALRAAMRPENVEALEQGIEAAANARAPWSIELKVDRPAAVAEQWVEVRGQALIGEDGKLKGMIGLLSDISERKERDERERSLMREVDHRAKNVLAVAQALARLTPFRSREQYLSDYLGRVGALGSVHGLLSRNRWRHVDLRELISDQLAALHVNLAAVTLAGEAVLIGPSVAQPLGLIVHELAGNALKHGALANKGGVAINWASFAPGRALFKWQETSSSFVAPTALGFGSTLIDSASRQIDGAARREWTDAGLKLELEFECGSAELVRFGDLGAQGKRAGPRGGVRVLIVEDELLVALDLKMMVEASGREVLGPAHTIDEALALIAENEFDFALLDANVRGRHIAPVAALLRERGTPFALVTGYEDPGLEAPIIQKPVTEQKLLAFLEAAAPRDRT